MGANSIIGDGIVTKFKLTQAYIANVVLLACKNEEDPFKIESTRKVTTFLPLSVYDDFPDAQGQLTLQSKYILKRVSFGTKDCTKELKLECAYFLGQNS